MAKETKEKYLNEFTGLIKLNNEIQQQTEEVIYNGIQTRVKSLFDKLRSQLLEIEKDVLVQIKKSDAMRNINESLEVYKYQYEETKMKILINQQRQELNDLIEQGRLGKVL